MGQRKEIPVFGDYTLHRIIPPPSLSNFTLCQKKRQIGSEFESLRSGRAVSMLLMVQRPDVSHGPQQSVGNVLKSLAAKLPMTPDVHIYPGLRTGITVGPGGCTVRDPVNPRRPSKFIVSVLLVCSCAVSCPILCGVNNTARFFSARPARLLCLAFNINIHAMRQPVLI